MRAALIAATFILGLAAHAQADDLTPAKEADIRQLMTVTGATKVGAQMGNLMGTAVFQALRKQNPQIPERVATVIQNEMNSFMTEKMDGPAGMISVIVPVYARAFTHAEIRDLLAFYRTPVGMKVIQTLPQVTEESAKAGQAWAQSLGPEINQRISAALAREGLVPAKQ